jgi:hypothetical protein
MNAREANEYLGKVFRLPVPGTALEVDVRVDDWKQSLGHDRLLVVPATGKGSEWVNVETLRFGEDTPALRGGENPTPLKHAGRRRT